MWKQLSNLGKPKKETHCHGFHIAWEAKDRQNVSGSLEVAYGRAGAATLCGMYVPCSADGLAGSCSGQGGGTTAKRFASTAQRIATSAAVEVRCLSSESVSLTLKSKHLREEASPQGINVPFPEFHE